MHTYVVDSTTTTRKLKKCYAVDSTATTRYIKKIWVVDSGGISRLVFESQSVFTMLAGISTATGITLEGFSIPNSFGSLSPSQDVNGNTVEGMFWSIRAALIIYQVAASSNPGQSYFSTFAIAGQGTFVSSAAMYGYSGGVATWQWPAGSSSFSNGNTYTITVSL
jgi:hypothetical protein